MVQTGTLYLKMNSYYEVSQLNPNSADAYFEKIKLLRMSNQTEEGIKESEIALKKFPNETKVLDEYGRLLILNGDKGTAKTVFNKALKIDSNDELALIMLGILAKNDKDVSSAVNYYNRSIAANQKNTKTVVALVNY